MVSSRIWMKIVFYLLLWCMAIGFLFPFFWMVFNSFKQSVLVQAYPPVWFFRPTFNNFVDIFKNSPFATYLINSAMIASGGTVVGIIISLPAAYSIASYKQGHLAFLLLVSRMLPGMCYLIPLFILYYRFGLIDTHYGLIFTYLLISVPLSTWLLIPFFEAIPSELYDAGLIDGCSKVGVFRRVALPLVTPGIAVSMILSFIFTWNDFIFVLILGGIKTQTLPLAAYQFISYGSISWGGLFSAATVITLPIIVISIFLQKYLVSGLTLGGVKG